MERRGTRNNPKTFSRRLTLIDADKKIANAIIAFLIPAAALPLIGVHSR
jgi:hypothetical protein